MSTCDLWWARVGDLRPEHDALLPPAELRRRDRFARPADRRRATASAVVLRLVLGPVLGLPPALVPVERGCPRCGRPHGRPRLAGGPEVSVAHAGDCLVVAVCADRPVGVDVEEVAGFCDTGLADVVLAREERRPPTPAGLATTWTRKEALLKATGTGLDADPAGLVLSAPGEPPRLLRGDVGPAWLVDLAPPAGLVGALAVLGDAPVAVRERDAAAPLRASLARPAPT
ncbi:4'-phosphopantetheinyl transferase family protein [Trujillonella humicola]|uniref:4'-phosphopantetheinyl transferase family protein n=1 Tax=Trujillonella humicola TaxID=3383699 RepID=UPI0039069024